MSAPQLRAEAEGFESGRVSAVADLPGPEDLELMLAEARAETGLNIPLSLTEQNPELLPRLVRPLLQGSPGTRVVYRVESLVGRSRRLIQIDANRDVILTRGSNVFLNFGSPERVIEWIRNNRPDGARVFRFEVDEEWIQSLRSATIPEPGTGDLKGQARLVDVRFAEDQVEIPARLIDELQRFIRPGSGRQVDFTP